uniref:Uncharacterized protein n=1 Tax=uncultured bacterium contig00107 TaxID=1181573 RepID=A0A806K2E3_9BACT|nr:hypothetical protein [uncultured bacterium contig00107]
MATNKKRKKHQPKTNINNRQTDTVNNGNLNLENQGIETLKNETDFVRYLELLKPFSKKYTVIICCMDTSAGGNDFTPHIGAKITALGTRINLAGMYRCAYAAIIHKGQLLFEKLGKPETEIVECETIIDNISVKIRSAPFQICKKYPYLECGITVDNLSYTSARSYNFVVFDTQNNKLLDSSIADTYPHIGTLMHYNYAAGERNKQIIAYKNAHPEISLITFDGIRFPYHCIETKNEAFIAESKLGFGEMMKKYGTIPTLEKYYENISDIKEVTTPPESYLDLYGVRRFKDTNSRLVNTNNGIRVTVG